LHKILKYPAHPYNWVQLRLNVKTNVQNRHLLYVGVYRTVILNYSAVYKQFCELFCRIRIRIALPAEHFDAAATVLIFTTSLCPSLIMAVHACCLAMTLSPSFVSHKQAVWARAAGTDTDWVKSTVDITSCTIHVQTNYSYSFWRHYSSKYEYTIRTTTRHRSEYEANIWYVPTYIVYGNLISYHITTIHMPSQSNIQCQTSTVSKCPYLNCFYDTNHKKYI